MACPQTLPLKYNVVEKPILYHKLMSQIPHIPCLFISDTLKWEYWLLSGRLFLKWCRICTASTRFLSLLTIAYGITDPLIPSVIPAEKSARIPDCYWSCLISLHSLLYWLSMQREWFVRNTFSKLLMEISQGLYPGVDNLWIYASECPILIYHVHIFDLLLGLYQIVESINNLTQGKFLSCDLDILW